METPENLAAMSPIKIHFVAAVMAIVVTSSELFLWRIVSLELGVPTPHAPSYIVELGIINFVVADLAGPRFFRTLGMSRRAHVASQFGFLFASAVLACLMMLSVMILSVTIGRKFDRPAPDFSGLIGLLGACSLLSSLFAADRLLHAHGMSQSGTSVETRERAVAALEQLIPPHEVVEYGFNGPSVKINLFLSILLCALGAVLLWFKPAHPATVIAAMVCFALFGGLAVQFALASDGCLVRVDQKGVFGYPARFALYRKLLYWTEIASCEIRTRHDPLGRPYLIEPVFKDQLGRKLMSLSLHWVPMVEQERIVTYIRAKLARGQAIP